MCLYPTFRKNRKYTITKKNKGNVPLIKDERTKYVPTACGKCMECKKAKARDWQVRLTEDIRHNKNGIFVTLTFSNESIQELYSDIMQDYKITPEGYELDNIIATKGVRRFLERWRKKYNKSIRHWLITEIGHEGTENIHLHGIIWCNKTIEHKGIKKNSIEEIRNIWKYGYIYPRNNDEEKINYVSERTINYITKYITKKDEIHTEFNGKILNSDGIGAGYLERMDSKLHKTRKGIQLESIKETYTTRTGHEINLPIYWRNKIWTEEEREQLWIKKLNKDERWVGGERIKNASTPEGEKEYYQLLEYHRKRAKKLGYQDNNKNWDKIKYENDRRKLNMNKRLNATETKKLQK